MLGNFALIGPSKKLLSFIRAYLRYQEATKPMGNLVALTITDSKLLSVDFPQYFSWEEMLSKHNLNSVLNLETDPEFSLQLRKKLPPTIQLSENSPSFAYLSLYLAKNLYQQKISQKESFLNQILENSPFATIVFNRKGEVIYWNKACEELTGVTRNKVLGKSKVGFAFYEQEKLLLGQNVLKYNLETLKQIYQEQDPSASFNVLNNGVAISGFWNLKGKLKGFYQVIAVKLSQGKKILGSLEIIHNISNIYELRSQVREYQEVLESLLNNLPYPLLYSLKDGRIIYINQAAKELFKSQLTSTDSLHIANFLDLSPMALEPGNSSFEVEISEDLWEVINISLKEKGMLWLFRNLSEEESKNKLKLVLSVAGAISHELSQPLTAVVNAAQLLAKSDPSNLDRIKRHQEIISKEGEKLFQIYTKLRNIEKVNLLPYIQNEQILDLKGGSEDFLNQILDHKGDKSGA